MKEISWLTWNTSENAIIGQNGADAVSIGSVLAYYGLFGLDSAHVAFKSPFMISKYTYEVSEWLSFTAFLEQRTARSI